MKPTVVLGSETCAVTAMDMEILKSIYGPVVEQGIWRVRKDQELRWVYKDLGIVVDIKTRN